MLQLRKMTQPLLDALGLEDLHVEIRSSILTIVGSCGKPLVTIYGIAFGSKPSVAEREYATELFERFLGKHGTDLKAFIEASKAFTAIDIPQVPIGTRVGIYGNFRTCIVSLPSDTFGDGMRHISIGKGFIQCSQAIALDKLVEIVGTYQEAVDAYLDAFSIHLAQSKAVESMRTKLQACTI